MAGNDPATTALLHLNGANTSTTITNDAAGGSVAFAAQGDAQISTAQSVFGGSSLLLDGTGDYVNCSQTTDTEFGTADLCIDFRFRLTSVSVNAPFFTTRTNASNYIDGYWDQSTGNLTFRDSALSVTGSFTPTINTWYHAAFVRKSGTAHIYIAGVRKGTGSLSGDMDTTDGLNVGRGRDDQSLYLNGYIDEFRISKGNARIDDPSDPLYISSGLPADGFTVPAVAYSEVDGHSWEHVRLNDDLKEGHSWEVTRLLDEKQGHSWQEALLVEEKQGHSWTNANLRGEGPMEYFFDLRNSAGVQVDTATGTPPTTVFTDIVQAPSPGDYVLHVRSVQTFKNMSDVVSETFYPFTMGAGGIELPFPNEVRSVAAAKRPAGAILLTWSYSANNEAIAPDSFEVYLDAVFNQSVTYTVEGNYSVTIPALAENPTVFKVTAKTGAQETTGLQVTQTPDSTAPLDNPFTWEAI